MIRDELIAALETAEGPNFALEQAIHDWAVTEKLRPSGLIPLNYTASIDAALTLVLEGVEWEMSRYMGLPAQR